MQGGSAVSTNGVRETRGDLRLELDAFPAVHAPHLDQAVVGRIAWADAVPLRSTIDSPLGAITVTCQFQYGAGAIRGITVTAESPTPGPKGYLRAILQPLMGLETAANGETVARVRYVLEADFDARTATTTIIQSYLLDGAGHTKQTE